jgi:hypothetical protein
MFSHNVLRFIKDLFHYFYGLGHSWAVPSSWNVLSRVQDSVTNNNGFWIAWLDLLTLLYNWLQQFTHHWHSAMFFDCTFSVQLKYWTTPGRETHCYTASERTPQKTHPFLSIGRLPYCCVFVAARCVYRSVTKQWMSFYCWLRVGWDVFT